MYENMDEKMLVLCNDGAVSARWEWCGEVGERQPASRPLLLTGSLGCALATSHGTCLTVSRTMVGRVCGASLLDQPNVTDCCLMLPHPLFAPSPVCTTRRMVGGAALYVGGCGDARGGCAPACLSWLLSMLATAAGSESVIAALASSMHQELR